MTRTSDVGYTDGGEVQQYVPPNVVEVDIGAQPPPGSVYVVYGTPVDLDVDDAVPGPLNGIFNIPTAGLVANQATTIVRPVILVPVS